MPPLRRGSSLGARAICLTVFSRYVTSGNRTCARCKSSHLPGHLRREAVQINISARRREGVWQQIPILSERRRTSWRDVIARTVRLQFAGRDLPGLWIPKAKSQTGDFRIDAVRRRRVALHERLMVRHHVRKPAGVRIEAQLRLTRRAEHLKKLAPPTYVRICGRQEDRSLRSEVVHHPAVR